MGIRMLNKFLRTNTPHALITTHIKTLRNQKIAVDISIYMYRFLKKKELVSSFFKMCALFRKYNIKPVFVFDGKPPEEKQVTLDVRRTEKKAATEKLHTLYTEMSSVEDKIKEHNKIIKDDENINMEEHTKKLEDLKVQISNINENIQSLEPKCVRLKNYHLRDVKSLISRFGMTYIEAEGEADETCAKLCKNGDVYAVLSEDMDLFAYGCPRVLRYFSMIYRECVLYDLKKILKTLGVSPNQFRLMCILAGTDYNVEHLCSLRNDFNIFTIYECMKNNIVWSLVHKIVFHNNTVSMQEKNSKLYEMTYDTKLHFQRCIYFIYHITNNVNTIHNNMQMFYIPPKPKQYVCKYTIENNDYDKEYLQEFLDRHYIYMV
jgi:5'-3' exonuclease